MFWDDHLISVAATSLSFQQISNFVSCRTNNIPTLARVNEEANPHDIEYPDIPSIPEESDEEQASLSTSPVNFPEFSPDTELVKPFKGILKKSNSVNVNS